jgi:hypothetical protein
MKPEDKAALKAGGATALVVGTLATLMANPVAWGAVLYGSYKMAKVARDHVRESQAKHKRKDTDHGLYI